MSTVKLEIFSTFCFLKELQHKQNTLTGYSCFWGNILGNRMNLCPEISENSLTKSKQHLVLQQEKKKKRGGGRWWGGNKQYRTSSPGCHNIYKRTLSAYIRQVNVGARSLT